MAVHVSEFWYNRTFEAPAMRLTDLLPASVMVLALSVPTIAFAAAPPIAPAPAATSTRTGDVSAPSVPTAPLPPPPPSPPSPRRHFHDDPDHQRNQAPHRREGAEWKSAGAQSRG